MRSLDAPSVTDSIIRFFELPSNLDGLVLLFAGIWSISLLGNPEPDIAVRESGMAERNEVFCSGGSMEEGEVVSVSVGTLSTGLSSIRGPFALVNWFLLLDFVLSAGNTN